MPNQGRVHWSVHSLFSGIECGHEAMNVLSSAIAERFNFNVDVKFELMALGSDSLAFTYPKVQCNARELQVL